MTCLAIEPDLRLTQTNTCDQVRAAVFWGFILLVIVSPAVLGSFILLQG